MWDIIVGFIRLLDNDVHCVTLIHCGSVKSEGVVCE